MQGANPCPHNYYELKGACNMAYATWEDYTDIFLLGREPSILQADFLFWERRARTEIDKVTFGRLKDSDTLLRNRDAVILATCELAEYFSADVVQESTGLSSVSVTGHSMSFDKTGSEEWEIIERHLGNTGLLFAGV